MKRMKQFPDILPIFFCIFISSTLYSQNSLEYLGQYPPGDVPMRFPPEDLLSTDSWFWHGPPIFSSDLLEMHWSKYVVYSTTNHRLENAYMKVEDTHWSDQRRPEYADINYNEKNPYLSKNGNEIYFMSEGRANGYIFKSIRTNIGWSQPSVVNISVPSGRVWGGQFSIARDNSIYLDFDVSGIENSFDIYVAKYENGQYEPSQSMGTNINSGQNDYMPFIDPDEEYIIFRSNRPGGYGNGDLYISFNNNNTWTEPVNMGPRINTDQFEGWPYVSPDKRYLFFLSKRDDDVHFNPYWVSSNIINELNENVSIQNNEKLIVDSFQLFQNYPNPFNPSTTISYETQIESNVEIILVDLKGKEIRRFKFNKQNAGHHQLIWNGRNKNGTEMAGGVYLYTIKAGDYTKTKKMLLMK